MPDISTYLVDVFATEKFKGNQLAVLRADLSETDMQKIAIEMNFSETTFITADEPVDGGYNVRIFTTASELPFAGHPTLGTAYIIRNEIIQQPVDKVILNLKVGQIPVEFRPDGTIWMRQRPPVFMDTYSINDLMPVFGLQAEDFDARYPIQMVSTGVPFIIIPLHTREALNRARMNPDAMKALISKSHDVGLHGALLIAPEPLDPENDLHARMLAVDDMGIMEDPATGSANGDLAAWLVKHRYFGTAHIQTRVEQGYQVKRPSLLYLDAQEKGDEIEVNVGGQVHMIMRGSLYHD